jgi:hypothetical protein
MVTISVDEAYALDILSIYEVKIRNCTDQKKIENSKSAYTILYKELSNRFGFEKMQQIIQSNEYKDLYKANEDTFYLVDKIRSSNEISVGKDIDNANMERFFCKQRIQSKFFDGQLLEVKTQHE